MGKRDLTFLVDEVARVASRLRHVRKLGYRPSPRAIAAEVAVARRPPQALLQQQQQRLDNERVDLELQTRRLYEQLLAHESRLQDIALLLSANAAQQQQPERQPYVDGLLAELALVAQGNQVEAAAVVAHWRRLYDELATTLRESRARLARP